MFLTAREKNIIEQIIKYPRQYTVDELGKHLNVSYRTCTRDINNIKKTLMAYNLALIKSDKKFFISGTEAELSSLQRDLKKNKVVDQNPIEIKYNTLVELCNNREPVKSSWLAIKMGITENTIRKYLYDLKRWLNNFKLEIKIFRGVGVKILGTEKEKRHCLTEFILQFFYENITSILSTLNSDINETSVYYYYVSIKKLKLLAGGITLITKSPMNFLNDQMRVRFILQMLISMQRIKENFYISNFTTTKQEIIPLEISSIINNVQRDLPHVLSDYEKNYIISIWKTTTKQNTGVQALQTKQLEEITQKLIAFVSTKLDYDLTIDVSLYNDLLSHLKLTIYQLEQHFTAHNPLLQEILQKYPKVYQAVGKGLVQYLPMFTFSENEISYIVLHFCATLERSTKDIAISALIVCPTGMGTSKMLLRRIQKEIPVISNLVTELTSNVDIKTINKFNLVFTTVPLPFNSENIFFVSPLLSKDNIKMVQRYISDNLLRVSKRNYPINPNKNINYTSHLEQIFNLTEFIIDLVNSLQILQLPNEDLNSNFNNLLGRFNLNFKQLENENVIPSSSNLMIVNYTTNKLGKPTLLIGQFVDEDHYVNRIIITFLKPNHLAEREQKLISTLIDHLKETTNLHFFQNNDYKQIKNEIARQCFYYVQKSYSFI